MNRTSFFNHIRDGLFKGKLNEQQTQGIEAILNHYEQIDSTVGLKGLAYTLATAFHETAQTMQPIEEFGKGHGKPYGSKLKYGDGPGKRVPYTKPDKIYYGRGHTQNTWFEIYDALTRAAKKQGHDWDFLNHPELLLQMEPSIWATFHAMKTGLYTGRKLSDYFSAETEDWVNARKIINGQDKSNLIAGYAKSFYTALKS